ncbi:unnamed protein product [Ixodes persulcatus]
MDTVSRHEKQQAYYFINQSFIEHYLITASTWITKWTCMITYPTKCKLPINSGIPLLMGRRAGPGSSALGILCALPASVCPAQWRLHTSAVNNNHEIG